MSNIIKEIDGLEVPVPEISLWIAQKKGSNEVFSNKDDLVEYISNYCLEKDEFEKNRDNGIYEHNDDFYINLINRLSIILPEIVRYDYLGQCLGKIDVFCINYFSYENKKLISKGKIFRGISSNGIVMYSEDGISWSFSFGTLDELYSLFEKYGMDLQSEEAVVNQKGRQLVKR